MSACVSILLTDAGVEAALLRGRGRSRQITKRHHLEAQVPPALAEEDSLAHLVHTVVEAVRQVDGVGRSASLIVPSTWCYYHRIELAGRRFHQASARFSLEEHLPTFLEDGHREGDRSFLLADWSPSPEVELLTGETRRILEQALDALPDHYRAVLVLRDVEELSNEEVAAALGESVASVKSRLHRARMALREQLTRHVGQTPGA